MDWTVLYVLTKSMALYYKSPQNLFPKESKSRLLPPTAPSFLCQKTPIFVCFFVGLDEPKSTEHPFSSSVPPKFSSHIQPCLRTYSSYCLRYHRSTNYTYSQALWSVNSTYSLFLFGSWYIFSQSLLNVQSKHLPTHLYPSTIQVHQTPPSTVPLSLLIPLTRHNKPPLPSTTPP